jgi:MFS family permease
MASQTAAVADPGEDDESGAAIAPAAGHTDTVGPESKRQGSEKFAGLAPFQSRAYRFLFVGTMLTMTGNFMQQVAQGWLIYDLTSSPTWLGVVSFARGIPMLILALVAGVVVDRFDRRLVLLTAQGLTALVAVVLALLIATDQVQPWHVAVTAFLSGCLFVLIIPARQALLSATVERSKLAPAIALMSTGQNSGRIIGPALAGVLIAVLGVAMSFTVQALGFVLALFCAAMLGPQQVAKSSRQVSAFQSLMEGVRYVWDDSTVLALVSLQAIPAFLIMPYTQLLPIFARDILQTGPDGLGMLMMANGVGSVIGSVIIVLSPMRRQGMFLFISLASMGGLLAVFAMSTWLPISVAIMGLIGGAQAIYLASNNTLVQVATPDELRGRVMSVYMMTWGLMPLGALPQGIIADWLGAPIVAAGTGLLACLVVIIFALRAPALRRL